MKKFLTLAIALVAIASQAASIDWKVTSVRKTYLYDSNGEKFSGNAYLVLATDVSELTSGTFADLQSGLGSKALDSISLTDGAYKVDPARTATASDSVLVAGTEYAFQLLFLDVASEKYSLSSTLSNLAYSIPAGDDARAIGFEQADVGAAASAGSMSWASTSGGGDDPVTPDVPEPATGALALAGLALLFRRRRA